MDLHLSALCFPGPQLPIGITFGKLHFLSSRRLTVLRSAPFCPAIKLLLCPNKRESKKLR
jgi:hypothetical protein